MGAFVKCDIQSFQFYMSEVDTRVIFYMFAWSTAIISYFIRTIRTPAKTRRRAGTPRTLSTCLMATSRSE
jgi:hypothetical protein